MSSETTGRTARHQQAGARADPQGSAAAYSGRIRRMFSRSQLIDPLQPIRSAITVAGIVGYCDNNILMA
jgi:hypothetical protein